MYGLNDYTGEKIFYKAIILKQCFGCLGFLAPGPKFDKRTYGLE